MTKKLLLADDSVTIQKVIGIIFATEDYELQVCDDGNQAFEKAQQELPDLVIADVSMPGKDGFELCQAIKRDPRLAHTSVLLLPGTFEHFDESRAEAVGADGWINKPFESQALLDKVAQLLASEPVELASAPAIAAGEPESSPLEGDEGTAEAEVDEVALGLDDVDESGIAAVEAPAADDSAEDIWDAVSFEEEDLQQPVDFSSDMPTSEEDVEVPEEVAPSLAEEDLEAEADFTFGAEEDALELEEDVPLASELEAPAGEDTDEAVLDLEEDAIIEEEPIDLPAGEAMEEVDFAAVDADEAEEEESLSTVEDDSAVTDADEDIPVVEPLAEETLSGEEEILDLEEDDILEEEPLAASDMTTDLDTEAASEPFSATVAEPDPAEQELSAPEVASDAADEFVEEPGDVEELLEETDSGSIYAPEFADDEPEAAAKTGAEDYEPLRTEDVTGGEQPETVLDVEEVSAVEETETDESEFYTAPAANFAAAAEAVETETGDSVVEQVEEQLRELSEEDLKEVIAKVAGPTIEKLANEMLEQIVWEVVPDLAEAMIKDEIRKIRQGAE